MAIIKYTKQGVKDLSHFGKQFRPKLSTFPDTPGESVYDYLYNVDEGEFVDELRSCFPRAEISYDDDWLKGMRTIVKINCCSRDNYYRFLIKFGYGTDSIGFQISMYQDIGKIKQLMDEIAPGWKERINKRRHESTI